MAKSRSETIRLLGMPIMKEGQASEAINPGYLIEFGGTNDIQVQDTAQQNCRRAFALENDLLGKTINDAYSTNERVRYASFSPGQELQAKVAAAAPAIVKGDALEAAGDGTLRKLTAGGTTIAFALEAVDNSSGTAEVFIQIEVA